MIRLSVPISISFSFFPKHNNNFRAATLAATAASTKQLNRRTFPLVILICDFDHFIFPFNRVFCHKLGSEEEDSLIFTEHDRSCCLDITSTKDFKYITINSNSRTSSEEGHFPNSIIKIKFSKPFSLYVLFLRNSFHFDGVTGIHN